MGLFKGLCQVAGAVAGVYVGGSMELVGSIIGNKTLENIGDNVMRSSFDLGEKVGEIADKVADEVVREVSTAISTAKASASSVTPNNSVTEEITPYQKDLFQNNVQEYENDDGYCSSFDTDIMDSILEDCKWSSRQIADYYGYSDDSEYGHDSFLDDYY